MDPEQKICVNCNSAFTIESRDFDFYARIGVPPPAWCPQCRLVRKMLWRNDHFLFRKKDTHGTEIFSAFPPQANVNIIDVKEWMSDSWDQNASGREYNFSKPFFTQFSELLSATPIPNRSVINLVNSDYVNNVTDVKNCYLIFGSTKVEDSYYSENLHQSKNCVDTSLAANCEISYECFNNQRCYRTFFSSLCEDSSDLAFCFDCIGCTDCFGCVGLRKKSYHFFNEPCTKEQYEQKIADIAMGSRRTVADLKSRFRDFELLFPVRYAQNYRNTNVTGEYITNSKNVTDSYSVHDSENLRYCQLLHNGFAKDSYDHYRFGGNTELIYESASVGTNCSRVMFSYQCFSNCSNLSYCFSCVGCSNCFGCIGLHNKQYCILNRQYSKEEYEALLPKIIVHMRTEPYRDKKGRSYAFGEFFPPEISPMPYNVSIAEEFFPLTKEEAARAGFMWHDPGDRGYRISKKGSELPDAIGDIPDSIVQDVIGCDHEERCTHSCTKAYRIIPEELAFYRRFNLPVPALCPNCRYFERIAQRNPISFWHRQCMCEKPHPEHIGTGRCPNEFETAYAPERPEMVYCEQCYREEVS